MTNTEPDPARVARYAEAIEAQCQALSGYDWSDAGRGAMAVADEECAALVAEVERLRPPVDPLLPDPARVARYAEAIYAEGAYCGDCEYLGWDECSQCRAVTLGYAKAAVALADSEQAAKDAEIERLGNNLGDLLCELTGGRLSKTNYDVRTMVREVEAYFEETADSEQAALVAERDELRAEVERLRRDNGELTRRWFQQNEWRADAEAKLARVEALHVRRPWDWSKDSVHFGQTEYPDRCNACRTSWPCPTAAALADAPAEQRAEVSGTTVAASFSRAGRRSTMAASEAAVAAAQAKAGCWFEETAAGLFCNAHHCYADQRHETRDECDVIAAIADAAVDADRASIQAKTLREAAKAIHGDTEVQARHLTGGFVRGLRSATRLTSAWLRARADRIEAQP